MVSFLREQALAQSTDDESLIEPQFAPQPPNRKKVVVGVALLAGVGLAAAWASSVGRKAYRPAVENAVMLAEASDIVPFEITPCDPLSGEPCENQCGDVSGYSCKEAGWVFCQNAVCDEEPHLYNDQWVAHCHCWQPTNTNESILPVESNSGANCVVGEGKGGEEMCKEIGEGKLWSTYGPTGDFLPGKPLESANCAAHTLWAWCWGAPCYKDEKDDVICRCPIMKSMNDANQTLSLAGPEQCPPNDEDPCVKGWTHNSMPAGASPSEYLPGQSPCYSYSKVSPVGSMPADLNEAMEEGEAEILAADEEERP